MSETKPQHLDTFKSADTLKSGETTVRYFRLGAVGAQIPGVKLEKLPYSLRVLLENLLRREDGVTVTKDDIQFLATWQAKAEPSREIAYMPRARADAGLYWRSRNRRSRRHARCDEAAWWRP